MEAFMTGKEKTVMILFILFLVCLIKHLPVDLLLICKGAVKHSKVLEERGDVINSHSILNCLSTYGTFILFGIFHHGILYPYMFTL